MIGNGHKCLFFQTYSKIARYIFEKKQKTLFCDSFEDPSGKGAATRYTMHFLAAEVKTVAAEVTRKRARKRGIIPYTLQR